MRPRKYAYIILCLDTIPDSGNWHLESTTVYVGEALCKLYERFCTVAFIVWSAVGKKGGGAVGCFLREEDED